MDQKNEKEQLPPIVDQLKEYLETYIELTRLKAIKRGTTVFAGIVTDVFVILGLSIAFLFVSLTLAFYLADLFHSEWKGFGSVSLIYLITIIIINLFKAKLEKPIMNVLIKRIFK